MKKIGNREDKNNFTSFQNGYKLLRGNFIWIDCEQENDSSKVSREIINLISILVSPINSQPLDIRFNRFLKRVFDISFSIFMITCILSWLIPSLAFLIKVDSKGPVFFLQKRNKKKEEFFNCIKFRSMIINEDADLNHATKNDSRITRIGKLLRNSHLDEFPQFINVLIGDMSVVGPRPHMISDNMNYEKLIDHYSYRSTVKPGITGLAQVMGFAGSVTNLNEMINRVKMDNIYIRHWSLKLDLAILYRTIFKPFR